MAKPKKRGEDSRKNKRAVMIRLDDESYEHLKEIAGIAPLAFYIRLVLDQHLRTPMKLELAKRAS